MLATLEPQLQELKEHLENTLQKLEEEKSLVEAFKTKIVDLNDNNHKDTVELFMKSEETQQTIQ